MSLEVVMLIASIIAVGFFALMHLADRADALRRASLVPITPLPVDVAIPAKWRRSIQNNRVSGSTNNERTRT